MTEQMVATQHFFEQNCFVMEIQIMRTSDANCIIFLKKCDLYQIKNKKEI